MPMHMFQSNKSRFRTTTAGLRLFETARKHILYIRHFQDLRNCLFPLHLPQCRNYFHLGPSLTTPPEAKFVNLDSRQPQSFDEYPAPSSRQA